MTYTLAEVETLDAARALAESWGRAFYAAACEGRDPTGMAVDGERHDEVVERWTRMVAEVRGLEAGIAFGAAAGALLTAQVRIGAAHRRADERQSYQAGVAVGRAERDVELAEAALREASSPRIRPETDRETMHTGE